MKNKILNKLTDLLFYLCILIFTIGLNFQDTPPPNGWYQQWMPDLNGRQITDMVFNDSLNGFSVTDITSIGDTGYILKTTNGGDNWNFVYGITRGFTSIQFVNNSTGYASGGSGGGAFLVKTTNEGLNWTSVNCPYVLSWDDMYVLNEDTLWLVEDEGMTGGVFRTTNGGVSWQQQLAAGNQNPDKIYMYNERIGFIVKSSVSSYLRKTTDGGFNWYNVGSGGFRDIFFIDSLTGWRANDYMKKTTDGGLTWEQQTLPQGIPGHTIVWGMRNFSNINKDTIWGGYATVTFPNLQTRGILYRTINGGENWFYQIPDTSFKIPTYLHTKFVSKLNGWAYSISNGIHTITGGDTTFYSNIKKISSEIPVEYKLYQNYPNPFNNETIINYELRIIGNTELSLYDISGKLIKVLIKERQYAGSYEYRFNGAGLSSGVYFYSLTVDRKTIDTKKAVLIK